jgi:hypothetical protein
MNNARALSKDFLVDLKQGVLSPLLTRVKKDDTLMLAIRQGYINVYYRGGNLLKIVELPGGGYMAEFDTKYNRYGCQLPSFPCALKSVEATTELVGTVPAIKEVMDYFFTENPKLEREFQQLVARENNYSSISNETEYFIVDIEVADNELRARFDMLAVRWLRTDRKRQGVLLPVLIEMKYGGNSLEGNAGIAEHLKDLKKLFSDGNQEYQEKRRTDLLDSLEIQLEQLDELGLLKFNRSERIEKLLIDRSSPVEVVFLLANVNPASTKLQRVIKEIPSTGLPFSLRFFASSFAGYGMHRANMLELSEMQARVDNLLTCASSRSLPQITAKATGVRSVAVADEQPIG